MVGLLPVFTKANTPWFYLDTGENVAHIGLGVVGLFFGIYGFVVAGAPEPNTFGLANLESPADNLLHLVVGAWALYAAFMGRARMTTA